MTGKTQSRGARLSAIRAFRVLTIVLALFVAMLAPRPSQASTLKTLHTFCSEPPCSDGEFPMTGLTRDSSGVLYGTTFLGGAHDSGVVFALTPKGKSWKFSVVHSFGDGGGGIPVGPVIADVSGNLYGITEVGGSRGCGTAYRLSPNRAKWKLTVLYAFSCRKFGGDPITGLSYQGAAAGIPYDGVSPLYGAFNYCCAGNDEVFSLTPAKGEWTYSTLHKFCPHGTGGCTDLTVPAGDLLVDSANNLYGVAQLGGNADGGGVYKLSPDGKGKWRESILYTFCQRDGCKDGSTPQGPLAMDSSGRLFGTTLNAFGENGVVYSLAPKGKAWRETVLHTFCQDGGCTDGYAPAAGVVMDASGQLFGTAEFGGSGNGGVGAGTLFQLKGKTFTKLYDFCSLDGCADGASPAAPLLLDAAGNLFGTTSGLGSSGGGTVFELSP